jgi:hypothetical protein
MKRLRQDIVLVPSAGVSKLMPLASMLLGHDIDVAVFLDGDEPGRREGKKLVDKLLSGDDRRCLFVGDFLANPGGELEDIFPRHTYLEAVHEAYPDVELDFTLAEGAISGVVNQVNALFERKGLAKIDKWRPAAVLRDRILQAPENVDGQTLQVVAKINTALNRLLS